MDRRDRKTILIVDDDLDMLLALQKRLTLAGYDVQTARNGAEALDAAGSRPVHAITLDVNMPGALDGLAVARSLKADPATAAIPVIFVTGKADDTFKERCSEVGGKYFITKPYDCDLLLSILENIFARDTLAALRQLSSAKRRQPVGPIGAANTD